MALERMKDLEEQVKAIPMLQVSSIKIEPFFIFTPLRVVTC